MEQIANVNLDLDGDNEVYDEDVVSLSAPH